MNEWFNKLPGAIAWKASRKQCFYLKKIHNFRKGEWIAVNGEGEFFTTKTKDDLIAGIAERKWFSPYYECVGVPRIMKKRQKPKQNEDF
jgi:hypothetical protein